MRLGRAFTGTERRSRDRSPAPDGAARVAPWRRALAIVVIVGVVAVGFVFDSRTESTVAPMVPPESEAGADVSAASTAWYCPMIFATSEDPERGSVAVLNTGDAAVNATLTVAPVGGTPVDVPLSVAARSRAVVNPGNIVDAAYAAATVKADGGGLAVEHGISDANGESWAPCAVEAALSWYFADGSTDNATTQIGLFNPFDEYAIVDVSAATDTGRAEPVEYQGVVIPARSLVTIDLADQLRRREWIATSVEVRRGKIVADQLVGGTLPGLASSDPVPPTVDGLSLALGTRLSESWMIPDVLSAADRTERVSIYNPTETEAQLSIEVRPDGLPSVPLTMFIPARGRFVSEIPLEAKLPVGTHASVRIRSDNGVPVAVVRKTTSDFEGGTGFSLSNAIATPARRWALPAVNLPADSDSVVWVVNERQEPVDVVLSTIGDAASSDTTVRVEPTSRTTVRVGDLPDSSARSLLVTAPERVFVSREIVREDPEMMSTAPGVALR